MNITFNLKDKNKDDTAIRIIITHKGKVYRKNSGITTSPKAWARQKTGNLKKDAELKRIRMALMERLDERSTPTDITNALDDAVCKAGRADKDTTSQFWEYFKHMSEREMATRPRNISIYRLVKDIMGDRDDWDDIDILWGDRLTQALNERNYSMNYQATVISQIKTAMNMGLRYNLHDNHKFKFISIKKEVPDTIYLTQQEVDKLWEFTDGTKEELDVRDLFIVGIYTASRFSDYSRFSEKNIYNGTLRFVQEKTNGSVIIPIAPRVREVLARHNGSVPSIMHRRFNKMIRIVCSKVGIDDTVMVSRTLGGKKVTTTCKKWELVSAHTARRTGATLLYLNGVSIKQCMFITGHESESSFMRYIRITKEENATMLQDNPFFK